MTENKLNTNRFSNKGKNAPPSLQSQSLFSAIPLEQTLDVIGADKNANVRHNSDMQVLSIKQAAEKLGISRSTLYMLLDKRSIPSYHIGRRRFITNGSLNNFIERRKEAEYDQ